MRKRLVRKLDLEMMLAQIEPHPSPRPSLEQYTIPADVAATILYVAAYTYNDIVDKTVLDLGCGTGRLALGAAFLGSKKVVGVDIDKTAIKMTFENSVKNKLKNKVQCVAADIEAVHGRFDTVLQNPPFGVQKRKADRKFLEKALKVGNSIYSLHKGLYNNKSLIKELRASGSNLMPVPPSPFLKTLIEGHNGRIKAVYAISMAIPHMFRFHTKRRHEFIADLYIIESERRWQR